MLFLVFCNIYDRECNVCDNIICFFVVLLRNNGVRFIINIKFLYIRINVVYREFVRILKFIEFIFNVIVCSDCCLNIWLFDLFKLL